MTILLDSSILIDHLRDDPKAVTAIRTAMENSERLVASVMTKVEILAGVRPGEERTVQSLFLVLDWIEVDDDIATSAGILANQYFRSHSGIDPIDYVIAATTQRLGAQLWTRNVKHFPMFPGLRPPY